MATLTSLYLCSRTVYAAVGSPTAGGACITAAAQMQLPEGCLINGVITNEADLADALKAFFAQNKLPASRVALIAGGSQFMHRILSLPAMSEKKRMAVLSHELSTGGAETKAPLDDYMLLSRDAKTRTDTVLATRVEQSVIAGYDALAKAAGFALIPVWITGGIHLDGYADTCDALSSYGDREKKLEILKDPHCGAFAVIRLCSYFAAYLALCACVQFTPQAGLLWMMALVLERALSGYAVAAFPMAKNTGLAHTFASAADRATVRRVLALLAAVLCCAMLTLGGWALVLAALAVLWRYHAVACKQFGGITGDLAGWFLQKTEIWMLAALCACQWGGLL